MGISPQILQQPTTEEEAKNPIKVSTNMRELTNRITVTLITISEPTKYDIEYFSGNASYTFLGDISGTRTLSYPSPISYSSTEKRAEAFFTTLSLSKAKSDSMAVVNKEVGATIFRENLISLISAVQEMSELNLECVHDFTVKLRMKPVVGRPGGEIVTELWINE